MNAFREIEKGAVIGVKTAEAPKDLAALRDPDCAAVILRRSPPAEVQRWLDALAPEVLPQARVIRPRGEIGRAARSICAASGTPNCAERDWLIDDIETIAEAFAEGMGTTHLRLRLDAVSSNSCRKFHVDSVVARLVCTYRGPGTQYGVASAGDAPEEVFSTPTGAPIALRGALWPERPKTGLVHRSPPIEGSGQVRLVMVLDPVDAPEEEL